MIEGGRSNTGNGTGINRWNAVGFEFDREDREHRTVGFADRRRRDVPDGGVLETVGESATGRTFPGHWPRAMVPLSDWIAGSRRRDSAFDPAHERIGRTDACRGDGLRCWDAPLHRRRKPLGSEYSFIRHGHHRLGKTPANEFALLGTTANQFESFTLDTVLLRNRTGGIHD